MTGQSIIGSLWIEEGVELPALVAGNSLNLFRITGSNTGLWVRVTNRGILPDFELSIETQHKWEYYPQQDLNHIRVLRRYYLRPLSDDEIFELHLYCLAINEV